MLHQYQRATTEETQEEFTGLLVATALIQAEVSDCYGAIRNLAEDRITPGYGGEDEGRKPTSHECEEIVRALTERVKFDYQLEDALGSV